MYFILIAKGEKDFHFFLYIVLYRSLYALSHLLLGAVLGSGALQGVGNHPWSLHLNLHTILRATSRFLARVSTVFVALRALLLHQCGVSEEHVRDASSQKETLSTHSYQDVDRGILVGTTYEEVNEENLKMECQLENQDA